jgi:hypothetical protein
VTSAFCYRETLPQFPSTQRLDNGILPLHPLQRAASIIATGTFARLPRIAKATSSTPIDCGCVMSCSAVACLMLDISQVNKASPNLPKPVKVRGRISPHLSQTQPRNPMTKPRTPFKQANSGYLRFF